MPNTTFAHTQDFSKFRLSESLRFIGVGIFVIKGRWYPT